jgi:hypothetical protein
MQSLAQVLPSAPPRFDADAPAFAAMGLPDQASTLVVAG